MICSLTEPSWRACSVTSVALLAASSFAFSTAYSLEEAVELGLLAPAPLEVVVAHLAGGGVDDGRVAPAGQLQQQALGLAAVELRLAVDGLGQAQPLAGGGDGRGVVDRVWMVTMCDMQSRFPFGGCWAVKTWGRGGVTRPRGSPCLASRGPSSRRPAGRRAGPPQTSPGRGSGCLAGTGTGAVPVARTPSSFSLRSQPAGSTAPSFSARSSGGGRTPFGTAFRARGGAAPTRAASAGSPRRRRRCLQVRCSMGSDWWRRRGRSRSRRRPGSSGRRGGWRSLASRRTRRLVSQA